MENPTPFDLNEAIRRWQQELSASPAFCADNLEELASHLRASVQKLQANGLSEEEAFRIAARRIGESGALEREFAKVNPSATRSLPVISFWVVAGIYFLQIVSSLVFGLLNLHQLLEQRAIRRLIDGGADPRHIFDHVSLFYYWPRSSVLNMSMVLVLVFIFGVRFAIGSWSGFGAFFKSFERPVRTALSLVVLGLFLALLPDLLASFLSPENPLTVAQTFAKVGLNEMYGLFALGYFETKFAVPLAGYVAGQAVVNIVLVSGMVLLARRGLRKISPADPIIKMAK